MRLLFAGTPAPAIPALEALVHSSHDVVAVLTRADAPQGRGRRLHPSPVKERALALELPVITEPPRGEAFVARLAELDIDAVAVVAYGEILRPEVIAAVPGGWVNLHFSVLPAWRGAAPVQRALLAGDEVVGATTFLIERELDAGPVLGVATQRVEPRTTSGELLDTLAEHGAGLLVATMDAIADGSATPVPQPPDGVSQAPKLTAAEGQVDWSAPAMRIDRLIRAFTPAPGAWTTTPDGRRLGLGPVRADPEQTALEPGALAVSKHAVVVGTGTDAVTLSTVTPQGKRAMPAADWARGAHLDERTRLGAPSRTQGAL